MAVLEHITLCELYNIELDDRDILKRAVTLLEGEFDSGKIESKGVWVYRDGIKEPWLFDRFDTIAEAVKIAINTTNATIICNGNIINYAKLNEETAYYIDEMENKAKFIKL